MIFSEKLKKTAENNRALCTRHKRHLTSGEFVLNNIEYEKLEKFNQQINNHSLETPTIQTNTNNQHQNIVKLNKEDIENEKRNIETENLNSKHSNTQIQPQQVSMVLDVRNSIKIVNNSNNNNNNNNNIF